MTETVENTLSIIVEEEFPHAPALLWRVIAEGGMMAKWIMPPVGFAPVEGQEFSFQTKPAGAWDGTIHCRVLEVRPGEKLVYSWAGGDAGNLGYGSRLNTTVTFILTPTATGTRLRVEHAGFEVPRNDVAYQNLNGGWKTVMGRIGAVATEAGSLTGGAQNG